MISIETLANVILNNCSNVSNKKLQKLSYYVYAWHLAIFQSRIADMRFEAWEHGPVCRALYNKYKMYGWNSIPQYTGFVLASDKEIRFIQSVLNVYGSYSADDLEQLSHSELPWIEARSGCNAYEASTAQLSDNTICQFYAAQKATYTQILDSFLS